MGKVESNAKTKRRRRNLQQAVLGVVGVAGVLAVMAIAPNVFQVLPTLTGNTSKFGYRARTAAGRLAQKGLLRFTERNGRRFVEITEKGQRLLALEKARSDAPARKKKRWDGRFRIVMFDIPQERKGTRDRLRLLMRQFGFLRLQNSVWVSPYDCEELVALVKAELRLGKDVVYVVAEEIENDAWVRRHFNLS